MVDLEATDSTPEGMGDNMTTGQNGQHWINDMQIWMETYDMILWNMK